MSNLVVMTFDSLNEARAARRALDDIDRIDIVDAAVITKDADGRVDIDNELESSTKTGAVVGTLLGALLFLVFPVVGMVIGAIGGAVVGKIIEPGVDQGFVREVTAALRPGGSALFVMFNARDQQGVEVLLASLRQFKGNVYQTTLSTETEQALRSALE